jgi:hypothetical protein
MANIKNQYRYPCIHHKVCWVVIRSGFCPEEKGNGKCPFNAKEVYSRSHIKQKNSVSDDMLKRLKKQLDDIISGELPCGEGGVSSLVATRSYIEFMETHDPSEWEE